MVDEVWNERGDNVGHLIVRQRLAVKLKVVDGAAELVVWPTGQRPVTQLWIASGYSPVAVHSLVAKVVINCGAKLVHAYKCQRSPSVAVRFLPSQ